MILGDRLFEERMLPRIFNLFYLCILIFDNTGEFMKTFLLVVCCLIFSLGVNAQQRPLMLYGDTSRVGVPYSKDPHVVNFKGRYLMYHSIPPMKWEPDSGWNIGIAESTGRRWARSRLLPKLIMRRKDFVHPVRW